MRHQLQDRQYGWLVLSRAYSEDLIAACYKVARHPSFFLTGLTTQSVSYQPHRYFIAFKL